MIYQFVTEFDHEKFTDSQKTEKEGLDGRIFQWLGENCIDNSTSFFSIPTESAAFLASAPSVKYKMSPQSNTIAEITPKMAMTMAL
jgi:hypothetical protein